MSCLGILLALTMSPVGTRAQVSAPPPPPDSTRRDSVTADSMAGDSARRKVDLVADKADTVKAPLAPAEIPVIPSIGPGYSWGRDPLVATGALTLGELVDRVPGLTSFRSGWIAAPEMAAWLGAFGRVRIFLDGVELDALNPRLRGQSDLSVIDMWQLEDATIEPGAGEIRVHLRSWRVDKTIPTTRIDVYTGDLQTNVFRGYYGRRFPSGHVLQAGGDHFATTNRRTDEAGDHTSLWGRAGWAGGKWTVDGSILRSGRKFTERTPDGLTRTDTLPTLDGTMIVATGRVAWGNPDQGAWWQALASAQSFAINNAPGTVVDSIPGPGGGGSGGSAEEPDTIQVSNDTTQSRPQLVLTGGLSSGPVRVSGAARLRRWQGRSWLAPALRASYDNGRFALSTFAERSALDSVQRLEAMGRINVLGNLSLSGSVSRASPLQGNPGAASLAYRGAVGTRLGRVWWTAGIISRDSSVLLPPVGFDTSFTGGSQGRVTGLFANIRGKFYRDVGIDFSGIRYPDKGLFRPQYETTARLFVDSDMRTKFPSGNLHILLALTHEYRSDALFPTTAELLRSSQYRVWGAELEIRLLSATITVLYRNFMGADYQQVPGFRMPGITSYYGIRWNFIN